MGKNIEQLELCWTCGAGLKGPTSLAEGGVVCHPNTPGWPCHVLSIYPAVYDGIGRNVCHEESFLQFAILPTFAKVV